MIINITHVPYEPTERFIDVRIRCEEKNGDTKTIAKRNAMTEENLLPFDS